MPSPASPLEYRLKKLLGYFLTWFVPSKKWRHIVRDVVYVEPELHPVDNLRRYMKCRRVARAGAAVDYSYYLAVCAIAKDEGPYFKEWIEYHRLVGVEKFYIYDNESTDDTKKILEPYIASGLVDYLYWPGQRQQVVAYNDCLRKHDTEARWLAYIDLDEFIVPVAAAPTVPEALKALPPNAAQINVGWLHYGSSGHVAKPEGLVTQNYKSREKAEHYRTGKCLVWPAACFRASVHVHHVLGPTVYENGTEVGTSGAHGGYDIIRINHYYCKSWEEYQRRRTRGDANRGTQESLAGKSYNRRNFDDLDRNDVYDPIMERWAEPLEKAMAEDKCQ